MRFFLIFLLATTTAIVPIAADLQGQGRNSFGTIFLDDTISLSFFTKPTDDALYFRLSWQENETTLSSLSSGRGVPPEQSYVYYWDDTKQIFWFVHEDCLQKFDMSKAKEGHTNSRTSNISAYKSDKDFPSKMLPMIEKLIQQK